MRSATILAALAVLTVAPPARADLQITMHDGLVSVNAKDVTVRQIMTEWAKVGQTKIINAEGITGGPVTLQLTDVPEERALEIVLRSISGYLAAPRQTPAANTSHFDRIVLVPTAVAPRPASAAASTPSFPQPRPQQIATDQDDDLQRGGPPPAPPLAQQQRGPVFNTYPVAVAPDGTPIVPQPLPVMPNPNVPTGAPTSVPTGVPSAAGGASVPGTIIMPPQPQPGQPIPTPFPP